ncbi:hypothetical protein HanLR1_Chr17g0671071 [Helianthus annuus]|nr:hypothetical protein HanHA89_Chr17g0712561 [Helianthus annuus]KAJ0632954.1 hypothetical protein HanLR1_Chr17g0671071 [Helianthus annuus]
MTSTSSEAVNVDGRKQELIDASEASVFFSGLLTQRKIGCRSTHHLTESIMLRMQSCYLILLQRYHQHMHKRCGLHS